MITVQRAEDKKKKSTSKESHRQNNGAILFCA